MPNQRGTRGRILPSRAELQRRIRDLENRIHEQESPQSIAKFLIEILEEMDLPDTAQALRRIFLDKETE